MSSTMYLGLLTGSGVLNTPPWSYTTPADELSPVLIPTATLEDDL